MRWYSMEIGIREDTLELLRQSGNSTAFAAFTQALSAENCLVQWKAPTAGEPGAARHPCP